MTISLANLLKNSGILPSFEKSFASKALQQPDALALIAPAGLHLSYGQLARDVAAWAQALESWGVGTESRVGFLLPNTASRVVAWLAISQAGGTAVPLDPNYPSRRLDFLLRDARIRLFITQTSILAKHPQISERFQAACGEIGHLEAQDAASQDVAIQDLTAQKITTQDVALPRFILVRDLPHLKNLHRPTVNSPTVAGTAEKRTQAPAESAAYMVYTSGSTGRPRGVLVSRRALAWYVEASRSHYALVPGDRVLQLASISFDISVGEIFPSLAAGATLVLHNDEATAPALLQRCQRLRVRVLFPSTALWHEMAEAVVQAPDLLPSSLRLLSFGGEKVSAARLRAWHHAVGSRVRLVNGYGPTETTVEATIHEFKNLAEKSWEQEAMVIGRPVTGVDALVLDRKLQPVGPGEEGELCLRSPGLARGYAGAPTLTAVRFVPDATGRSAGGRLYRSGDRVHLRDGTLEFLGRIDAQVKIRGFRVEPGEVEAALLQMEEVLEAAVVAREEEDHRRLAAFLVVSSTPPTTATLRRHLQRLLPPYLIPAFFNFLDTLPKTPRGKVDRTALSKIALPSPQAHRAPSTPADPLVAKLAQVWAKVLRLPSVIPRDDFFELGGDSILGIRIATEARRQGLHLVPQDLFRHPTLVQLARVVRRTAADAASNTASSKTISRKGDAPLLQPTAGPVPITPVQHWFFDEAQLEVPWHFNQSHLLRATTPLEPSFLTAALGHLVATHDALRLRFSRRNRQRVQWAVDQETAPLLLVIDLSHLGTAKQRTAAQEQAATQIQGSLHLRRGPLLRAGLFLGGLSGQREEMQLLLAVHHLAVDGVTWQILLEDLETLYGQLQQEQPPHLTTTTPFTTWAAHQSLHAGSSTLLQELPYWLKEPSNPPPLPLDLPQGENTLASTETVTIHLDAMHTEHLLRRVPAAYGTQINDVLLTALVLALEPWLGERRLLVDVEGHGREEILPAADVSRTAGWFTSTFPVCFDLRGKKHPGAALKTVRDHLRSLPHHGIGFGMLRTLHPDLAVRQRLLRLPPAEMTFNYLGQLDTLLADSKLFRRSPGPRGVERLPKGRRGYVLDVDGGILEGQLQIHWHFSRNQIRRQTVEQLAQRFQSQLEVLIHHCLTQRKSRSLVDRPQAEDAYPLSPMQHGMLFHTLYAPERAVYFEQSAWTLRGPLDADTFRAAWQFLVDRHPILRTRFSLDGTPLQVVHRRVEVPFEVHDGRTLAASAREPWLKQLLNEDRRRGFDLARPPLMRVLLIHLEEDTWRFVWSSHHCLLDGWSISLLFDELFLVWQSLHRGEQPSLTPPLPYREYIAWLANQETASPKITTAEDFWRRQLAGFRRPTPIVRPLLQEERPTETPTPFVEVRRRLCAETTTRLNAWGRRQRLTMNTLVQGAWALVLARHCGEDDVLFGVTGSGRPAELEGVDTVVGLMINTLPLRVRTEHRRPLRPWLRELLEHNFDIRQFEHIPLDRIAGWSEIPPPQPLFHSLLVFENYPTEVPLEADQRRGELEIFDFEGFSETNYPLTLAALPKKGLLFEAAFDPRRIETATMQRLLRQLETLLNAFTAEQEQALGSLPWLGVAERHQLLWEWGIATELPQEHLTVPGCFAEQAEQRREAIAVVDLAGGGMHVSYQRLARRVGGVAAALEAEGIGAEDHVALCFERGVDLIVAMLGSLAVGASWLPLSPDAPSRRLAALLADAQPSRLLSHRALSRCQELFSAGGPPVLLLDSVTSAPLPAKVPDSRHPAYVIYTSGSTGRPKGVVVEHRALAAYAYAAQREYGFCPQDRVLQLASPTFDISVQEIFPTLAVGATLLLAPADLATTPEEWWLTCRRQAVTYAFPATPLWHELARVLARQPHRLPTTLRGVVFGGERVQGERLADWFQAVNGEKPRLVNGYGPTEATVEATLQFLRRGKATALEAATEQAPLIGRPLLGAVARVYDSHLRAAAPGVAGELCLGGRGLARGYLRHPSFTAERFVPNPDSRRPGERLYKSGDRVRFREDGRLEILGRLDNQVKVRGFRIEPAEIEASLERHPQVEQAVVTTLGSRGKRSGKQLVAYITRRCAAEMPFGLEVNGTSAKRSGKSLVHWEEEQIERWRSLHEEAWFHGSEGPSNTGTTTPGFEAVGWNSSYTDAPIPASEMKAWLAETLARIRILKPRRLLEIGCGESLLLKRLAADGVDCLGTDFSQHLLELAQKALKRDGLAQRVRLEHRLADNFDGLPQQIFDTVVINSVVQYFPGISYLRRVLEGAVAALAPGGSLFIGDLRSLPLFDSFCASVEFHRASPSQTLTELRQALRRRRQQEKELLVDPAFFLTMARQLSRPCRVRLVPKEGTERNELNLFRYDATLEFEPSRPGKPSLETLEMLWSPALDLPTLRHRLTQAPPEALILRQVLDRRLATERALLRELASGRIGTVAELRRTLPEGDGLLPVELRDLARECGYHLELSCVTDAGAGSFDALLTSVRDREVLGWPLPIRRRGEVRAPSEQAEDRSHRLWASYGNDPLRDRAVAHLVPSLRHHLAAELPDYMVPAHFVVLDTLPKHPSGKVDHQALPPLGEVLPSPQSQRELPRGTVETTLAEIWQSTLGTSSVGRRDDYFALGGDSILSIQIVAEARRRGLRLTPRDVFLHPTVKRLAELAEPLKQASAQQQNRSLNLDPEGAFPLTPMQLWFTHLASPNPHHYNQSLWLHSRRPVHRAVLHAALAALLRTHHALRLRFEVQGSPWYQRLAPDTLPPPLTTIDLRALSADHQELARSQAAAALQTGLRIDHGPLLRCAQFQQTSPGNPVLLVIHHLAVDQVSWSILLHDLEQACAELEAGRPAILDPPTVSFAHWAQDLSQLDDSPKLRRYLASWLKQPAGDSPLPVDFPPTPGEPPLTFASARRVRRCLDAQTTRKLLGPAPSACRARLEDLLLTALLRAFASNTDRRQLFLELEGHGRDGFPTTQLDLSRTVGWLTATWPVVLELAPKEASKGDLLADLRRVKECVRRTPRGPGYGHLLHRTTEDPELRADLERLRNGPRPQLAFNYLGRLFTELSKRGHSELSQDGIWHTTSDDPGPEESPATPLSLLLEINAWVADGCFHAEWTYSTKRHLHTTILRWAESFLDELQALVTRCLEPGAHALTPADFPHAELELPHLLGLLEQLPPTLPIHQVEEILTLSPTQEGMLFHHRLAPSSTVYFEQLSWPLENLHPGLYRTAWEQLLERHGVLRTAFFWEALPHPLQVVAEEVVLPFLEIDWSGLPAEHLARLFEDLLRNDRRHGFDLSLPPLTRVLLVRFDACQHHVVWSSHHLLFDGWSTPLLLEDLNVLYQNACWGEAGEMNRIASAVPAKTLPPPTPRTISVPPRPRPYRDFIVWQKAQGMETAERFFPTYLAGVRTPSSLPADRPSLMDDGGAGLATAKDSLEIRITFSQEESDALEGFARRHRLTISTVVQGAWALCLAHATVADEVLFGVTLAGRPAELEGAESMIGLFINTLPLRVGLHWDQTPALWLQELQKVGLELRRHEHISLSTVRAWSEIPRHLPFFESLVVFESYPAINDCLESDGREEQEALRLADLRGFSHTNYPLTVMAVPEHPLALYFLYDPSRFDTTTAQRFLQQLRTSLVDLPRASRLGSLDLLNSAQRHQLLHEWGRGAPAERFEALPLTLSRQAAETPETVAVADLVGHQLSYFELARRSNALANRLGRLGAGPESRIAIALERTPQLFETLWAVLATGAAYLPLDPEYPSRRLASTLEDAAPTFLLTDRACGSRLPTPPGDTQVLVLEPPTPSLANSPTDERHDTRRPSSPKYGRQQLAYLIYTSGSTGRPKGVAVSHGALANFLSACQRQPGFSNSDIVLATTTLSFDIAILELFAPLLAGGRVVLADHQTARDGQRLATALAEQRATLLQATPAAWNLLEASGWQGHHPLRMLSGGEELPVPLAQTLLGQTQLPHTRSRRGAVLSNLYGPTEATVWSHYRVVDRAVGHGSIPLGHPLSGILARVVDHRLRLLPPGAVGELCLGGFSIARGYHRRPALTAQCFVPHPWGGKGTRIYKTGDLVRILGNGDLQFLGRRDQQVKIRGVRLELGEIEAVLGRHPVVRQAAVLLRPQASGDQRLVACVVPERDTSTGDHVARWRAVWDEFYTAPEADEPIDPTFNTAGWISSFTGEAIPAAEMREWLEGTVERILDLGPRRILEIGCGTGLLLFSLAPKSELYVGTEISSKVLAQLSTTLKTQQLPQVHLRQLPAHQISHLGGGLSTDLNIAVPAEGFDTVVLNSVAQYFPDLDYLAEVLTSAVEQLAPGGRLFLGDVRSHPLHAAFCANLESHHTAPQMDCETFWAQVENRQRREEELLVAPEFFVALGRLLPQVAGVRLLPKVGKARNEMQLFRYDVVLELAPPLPLSAPMECMAWSTETDLEALRRKLEQHPETAFTLCAVPDRRLQVHLRRLELLNADERPATLQALERSLPAEPALPGFIPHELLDLGRHLSRQVELALPSNQVGEDTEVQNPVGTFSACFHPRNALSTHALVLDVRELPGTKPDWQKLGNQPPTQPPWPRLRCHLARWLPEAARPNVFLQMEDLPLTPAGKIDRTALAQQVDCKLAAQVPLDHLPKPPQTTTEKTLANLWCEALTIEGVGRDDHFFELGGHSLAATRVAARLPSAFGIELPLRSLFDHPTLEALARLIDHHTDQHREGEKSTQEPPLLGHRVKGPQPLSFAQERLAFLTRLEPRSWAYHMADAVRLQGHLRRAAFTEALEQIVHLHPLLSTAYCEIDGELRQEERPPTSPLLPLIDLKSLPLRRRKTEALRLAGQEMRRPFALHQRPPFRCRLVALGEMEHLFLRTIHHIASDGWSEGIFYRQLGKFYGGKNTAVAPSPHPASQESALTYIDFALWQRQLFTQGHLEAQRDYWRERMKAPPAPLRLPADHPRRSGGAHRGAEHRRRLPRGQMERLETLARQQGATLFMVLLAGFGALLHRLSGGNDLIVGTPVAGRRRRELEPLLGCFVNTLPIRLLFDGNPSFAELLGRVRHTVLEALAHQDLPFEKLVEDLTPERRLDTNPLFQVLFSLQELPREPLDLPGLEATFEPLPAPPTDFEPSLTVQRRGSCSEACFEYDPDAFDSTTVERWLRHLERLLNGLLDNPHTPLEEISLLSCASRHQVLTEWGFGPISAPRTKSPVDQLAEHAARAGHAIALATPEGFQLSYQQLHRQVQHLAARLRRRGAGAETRVGVLLTAEPELPKALFAVLAVGATYIPLDPELPSSRLGFLLANSGVSLLITRRPFYEHHAQVISRHLPTRGVFQLDPIPSPMPSSEACEHPLQNSDPEHAAYIIYTSGSTGQPKGVVVTRENLERYIVSACEDYYTSDNDRLLQLTSASFDNSVAEIFPILTAGGTLVMAGGLPGASAETLRLLAQQRITLLMPPTALWHQLAAELVVRPELFPPTLERLAVGGEALSGARLADWLRALGPRAPAICLLNSYGPTETTVGVAHFLLHKPVAVGEPVAIGYPVRGSRLLVLDQHLRPLAMGLPGELCIAGDGLTRGYLDRPATTAQVFVPNPWAQTSGERLYASGDRARWRADGVLEVLDRLDRQVKIRGFRVEPAEVETTLARHPTLAQVAVLVREVDGERQLEAFVTTLPGTLPPQEEELRHWLREQVPAYLVPARCQVLDHLPLTTTGKVDRKNLAQLAPSNPLPRQPPRTATEKTLAGLWCELLGLNAVGRDDDFFVRGGHSLAAIRLVSRLRLRLGVELPLRQVFEAPTLAHLAKCIDRTRHAPSW